MRFNCEICGKQFDGKPAAMAHHREKHEGRAHIIPGTGRSVLRRQINEAQAEIARLQAEVDRLSGECERKNYEIKMHSSLAEHARVGRDTAWNGAIEAAARELMLRRSLLSKQNVASDVERDLNMYDLCIEAIRALRREKVE